MDENDKFWITITAIVATAVVLFTAVLTYGYNVRMKAMMDAGYEETTAAGQSRTFYQKAD